MRRDTAWYLRRYRDRALPDWRMRQILERELQRAIADHSALRAEMDELRRATPDRLIEFDAASDLALQWLAEGRFELAQAEIQKAGRELAELQRCATVAAGWRRACAALDDFENILSPALATQPTVRILQRLRDLARSFLDQGEMRTASFVIVLVADQIGLLVSRRGGELAAIGERMLDDPDGQSAAVARIQALAREGYHILAERLADDLEAELAVSDRARSVAMAGSALGALESDLSAVRQQAQTVQATLTQWLASSS